MTLSAIQGSARHLHQEIAADYNDMIYAAAREEIETRRKSSIRKWPLKHRPVAESLEEAGDRSTQRCAMSSAARVRSCLSR
jgi:hypothetical protein